MLKTLTIGSGSATRRVFVPRGMLNLDSWVGNVGLLTTDSLGASTVTQLNPDEAHRLAAALTDAARLLEDLDGD